MRRTIVVAVLGVVLASSPLTAQSPFHLGVGGGVSVPVGDLADATDVGWNALATVAVSTLMQPIGLRLDIAYNRFNFSDDNVDGNTSVGSGTLNLTYRLPMTNSPLSPFVIAGLGAYRTDCSLPGCDDATRFGWNAGLGTKVNVLGIVTFLEARYHSTKAAKYIPVTVGFFL